MKTRLALAALALSLSACASLMPPPSADELAGVPVVRYGQPVAAGKNFILHYPAGVPLPVESRVSGNIFEKDEQAALNPRLKQDIYLYKTWLSFDGKTWQRSNELIGGNIELHLPGEQDGSSPGRLSAEFNRK